MKTKDDLMKMTGDELLAYKWSDDLDKKKDNDKCTDCSDCYDCSRCAMTAISLLIITQLIYLRVVMWDNFHIWFRFVLIISTILAIITFFYFIFGFDIETRARMGESRR